MPALMPLYIPLRDTPVRILTAGSLRTVWYMLKPFRFLLNMSVQFKKGFR